MPCYGVRLHTKRFHRKTPVADRYLTDRTQRRTEAGAQTNPPGWTMGATRCSSQRRQALYSLRLLRTGSAPRSFWMQRTSPGDAEAMCLSGGRPETKSHDDED
jgi:hypothetical protein